EDADTGILFSQPFSLAPCVLQRMIPPLRLACLLAPHHPECLLHLLSPKYSGGLAAIVAASTQAMPALPAEAGLVFRQKPRWHQSIPCLSLHFVPGHIAPQNKRNLII